MVRRKTIIFVYLALIVSFVTIQAIILLFVKAMNDDDELAKYLTLPSFYDNVSSSSVGKLENVTKQINNFDSNRNWLVFFHIQKTSGTNFDQEMVKHLQIRAFGGDNYFTWNRACSTIKVKRLFKLKTKKEKIVQSIEYECKRASSNVSWILSWHETHWNWNCGLHPVLSDLRSCISKKFQSPYVKDSDFFFLTMLREPLSRFVSEWRHVRKKGSVWVFEDTPKTVGQNCSKGSLQTEIGKGC
jgi:hypothetical protein